MPATPTDILMAEVACFRCYGVSMGRLLLIALLRRSVLAVDLAADVSPQGLAAYGSCYACLGLSMGQVFILSLLDMLAQALGGETFYTLASTGDALNWSPGETLIYV